MGYKDATAKALKILGDGAKVPTVSERLLSLLANPTKPRRCS